MGIKPRMAEKGWTARAPLCEKPFISLDDMATDAGLWKQKLYQLGFPHANCAGRCVKQGQSGWALLYRTMPERFIDSMNKETDMRQYLGKDVSILRDRRGGVTTPLTLRSFRERLDAQPSLFDDDDWGACGCLNV